MATNSADQGRKKAASLQRELETLLALEKLEVLAPSSADEIRNIVAEGIADKFGETYRAFPGAREGTEIRRDAKPQPCALRKSVEKFVGAAHAPEKVSQTAVQKKGTLYTAKQYEAFIPRPFVNPQQKSRPKVNTPARDVVHKKNAQPRNKASPEKQKPKTFPKPSNRTNDGVSQNRQMKSVTQGKVSPITSVNQKGDVHSSKGGKAAAPAALKNDPGPLKKSAPAAATDKDTVAPQSHETAAILNSGASDGHHTSNKSNGHKSASSTSSLDFGSDLILFDY